MTDKQANIIAKILAFVVQVALTAVGVYFLGQGLGHPLGFLQIVTISSALILIRSANTIEVTRNT
jgi:multisubunit Na+/H+ antiporter MnhB subunit